LLNRDSEIYNRGGYRADDKGSISYRAKLFSLYHYVQTYLIEIQTFKLKIKFTDTQSNKYPQALT
jgi:hypothetical protein